MRDNGRRDMLIAGICTCRSASGKIVTDRLAAASVCTAHGRSHETGRSVAHVTSRADEHLAAQLNELDRATADDTDSGVSVVDRPRDGDHQRFDEIERAYRGMVHAVCMQITRNAHDADDATQAVFLTLALELRGENPPIRAIGPWLRRVARRASLDLCRSQSRRVARERSSCDARRVDDSTSARAIDQELLELVRRELDRLPTRYRTPMILHYFGGLDASAIARQLKCKPKTLNMRLFRARKMLAQQLARRGVAIGGAALVAALAAVVRDHVARSVAGAGVAVSAGAPGSAIAPFALFRAPLASSALHFARSKVGVLIFAMILSSAVSGSSGVIRHTLRSIDPHWRWPIEWRGRQLLDGLKQFVPHVRVQSASTEQVPLHEVKPSVPVAPQPRSSLARQAPTQRRLSSPIQPTEWANRQHSAPRPVSAVAHATPRVEVRTEAPPRRAVAEPVHAPTALARVKVPPHFSIILPPTKGAHRAETPPDAGGSEGGGGETEHDFSAAYAALDEALRHDHWNGGVIANGVRGVDFAADSEQWLTMLEELVEHDERLALLDSEDLSLLADHAVRFDWNEQRFSADLLFDAMNGIPLPQPSFASPRLMSQSRSAFESFAPVVPEPLGFGMAALFISLMSLSRTIRHRNSTKGTIR